MYRGMYRKGPHGPFCVSVGNVPRHGEAKVDSVSDTVTRITSLVAPLLESLGLELWGLEYSPTSGRSLLRVYINVTGRHVAIEDCERASREISAAMDVHDPISGEYTLEVSSPGIDRPLYTPAQFALYCGQQIKLTLRLPQDGRRRMQGAIKAADAQSLTLQVEDQVVSIAFTNIEKARVVPDLVALGLASSGPVGRAPRKQDKG